MAEPSACPFCNYAGPSEILHDFGDAYVIEPLRPVVDGHVMVIPVEHVSDFAADSWVTALVAGHACNWARMRGLADANLITSKGSAATQSVPHFHMHVLPRSAGDGLTLPWANPHEREDDRP